MIASALFANWSSAWRRHVGSSFLCDGVKKSSYVLALRDSPMYPRDRSKAGWPIAVTVWKF
jgi:hypothetical protein